MNSKQAMERGELTEEEAYFLLRFAGHMGYEKAIKRLDNPWKSLRRWFVWFGGWERPELSQWDRGAKAWDFFNTYTGKRKLNSPTPMSILGHRVTFHGWGVSVRICKGSFVMASDYAHGKPDRIYWSPDGTPQNPGVKMFWMSKAIRAQQAME